MALPSWVGADRSFGVADSPWTAPGYRLVGRDFYTCVEPVDRACDRAVLAWIREFCPDIIPIWRKQTYIAPGEKTPFVAIHLGLARFVKDPTGYKHIPYVEMPAGATHPMPNVLEILFEDTDHPVVMHEGGPAPYEPLTMERYLELRRKDTWNDLRPQSEIQEENLRKREEAKARAIKSWVSEMEYRQKHVNKFIEKHMNAPGDDLAGYRQYCAMKALERRRRRAIVAPKPFVHVRGV